MIAGSASDDFLFIKFTSIIFSKRCFRNILLIFQRWAVFPQLLWLLLQIPSLKCFASILFIGYISMLPIANEHAVVVNVKRLLACLIYMPHMVLHDDECLTHPLVDVNDRMRHTHLSDRIHYSG
jgi:hypothetical protein